MRWPIRSGRWTRPPDLDPFRSRLSHANADVIGHFLASGSLVGPASVLLGLKVDANLYVQIGLILLIALSAKNAILIVEVARERRIKEGHSIVQSAIEAAQSRLRPILMTSIAFILSVVPLVIATGAGASARKSIGITVFTGMIASTCLAVLFVPSLFVVIQRFEEWTKSRKDRPNDRTAETVAAE